MVDRSCLQAGMTALGLQATDQQIDQLLAYEALLMKWNRTYNLTAVRDAAGVRVQHLLDSLTLVLHVDQRVIQGRVLDVGSGGGLPGIPLAIMRPGLNVTLVDAVQKKVSFLQQVCIELGLKNVTPIHTRVETLDQQFDIITSRAFAEISLFTSLTVKLLAKGGRWLAMKGVRPDAELRALPETISVEAMIPLQVPGLDAERHLIVLKVVET